jgi:acyl-CoA thioesterase FadM
VTGERRTLIHRESDGALLMEVTTLWVWIRTDGRPTRIPRELRDAWRR